jgi:hypothetical protein
MNTIKPSNTTDAVTLNRRQLLARAAALGVSAAMPLTLSNDAHAARRERKTPDLTTSEIAAIDAALGKKGKYVDAEAVYTVSLPRADLHVKIKDQPVPTSFGFGGWVSFKRTRDGKSAMLMGDTVLLQDEVNGLITAAQANGLEVTAIHNHFFYEEPRIIYMHLHGMGDPIDLAARYAAAIRGTKLFPANQPPAGPAPDRTAKEIYDIPALDAIIGHTGAVNGPVYKYTIGRDDLTVVAMNVVLTAAIGLNTWAAFSGTPEESHIAGDVAMLASEVNPVIAALRANGLEVVSIHNHMLAEDPRIFFLHYYGHGPAISMARGFKDALDRLGKK